MSYQIITFFCVAMAMSGCRGDLKPNTTQETVSLQVKAPMETGWRALAIGDTLHSGDRFALRIEVTAKVYLWVSQRSANGKRIALLPQAGAAPVLAEPGKVTQLPPADGSWFQMDQLPELPGKPKEPIEEDLYLVASKTLIDDAEVQKEMDRAPKDRGDPPPTPTGKDKRSGDEVEKRGYSKAAEALIKPLSQDGKVVMRFWLLHD